MFKSVWHRGKTAWMVLVVFVNIASQSMAQTHVSGMSLDWSGWRFKPLYQDTSGLPQVTGFVALADSGLTTGDNIVAVWYVRDVATHTWTVKSWLTDDVTEAVKSVKIQAGIADSEDEHWDLDFPLSILAGENPELPKDYDKGLLIEDALYPAVATSPDAALIVELLASVGYKAADIELDQTETCAPSHQLDLMAAAFEVGISKPVVDELTATDQSASTSMLLSPVFECQVSPLVARTTLSVPTPWTCPVAPSSWRDAMDNSTGTGNCEYKRTMSCSRTRTKTVSGPPLVITTHTQWQIQTELCFCARNPSGTCPPPGTCCSIGAFVPTTIEDGVWAPPL